MTKNESRERCFQNALGMLTALNVWLPRRQATLSVHEYKITLSIYFDKDEKELLDTVVDMLEPLKLDWADYSENYYKENEFYCAEYTWDIVE